MPEEPPLNEAADVGAAPGGGSLIDAIELRVTTPTQLGGLDDAVRRLQQLKAALEGVNAQLQAFTQPIQLRKTTADIQQMLVNAEKRGGFGRDAGGANKPIDLKLGAVAQALHYRPEDLQRFIGQALLDTRTKEARKFNKQLKKDYDEALGQFTSLRGAARTVSAFTRTFDPSTQLLSIGNLLRGQLTAGLTTPQGQPAPVPVRPVETRRITAPAPLQPADQAAFEDARRAALARLEAAVRPAPPAPAATPAPTATPRFQVRQSPAGRPAVEDTATGQRREAASLAQAVRQARLFNENQAASLNQQAEARAAEAAKIRDMRRGPPEQVPPVPRPPSPATPATSQAAPAPTAATAPVAPPVPASASLKLAEAYATAARELAELGRTYRLTGESQKRMADQVETLRRRALAEAEKAFSGRPTGPVQAADFVTGVLARPSPPPQPTRPPAPPPVSGAAPGAPPAPARSPYQQFKSEYSPQQWRQLMEDAEFAAQVATRHLGAAAARAQALNVTPARAAAPPSAPAPAPAPAPTPAPAPPSFGAARAAILGRLEETIRGELLPTRTTQVAALVRPPTPAQAPPTIPPAPAAAPATVPPPPTQAPAPVAQATVTAPAPVAPPPAPRPPTQPPATPPPARPPEVRPPAAVQAPPTVPPAPAVAPPTVPPAPVRATPAGASEQPRPAPTTPATRTAPEVVRVYSDNPAQIAAGHTINRAPTTAPTPAPAVAPPTAPPPARPPEVRPPAAVQAPPTVPPTPAVAPPTVPPAPVRATPAGASEQPKPAPTTPEARTAPEVVKVYSDNPAQIAAGHTINRAPTAAPAPAQAVAPPTAPPPAGPPAVAPVAPAAPVTPSSHATPAQLAFAYRKAASEVLAAGQRYGADAQAMHTAAELQARAMEQARLAYAGNATRLQAFERSLEKQRNLATRPKVPETPADMARAAGSELPPASAVPAAALPPAGTPTVPSAGGGRGGAGGGGGGGRKGGVAAAGGGSGGGDEDTFAAARLRVLQDLEAQRRAFAGSPRELAGVTKRAASQLQALGARYELSGVAAERLGLEIERLRTRAVREAEAAFSQDAAALKKFRDSITRAEQRRTREDRRERDAGVRSAQSVGRFQADIDRSAARRSEAAANAVRFAQGQALSDLGHRQARSFLDDLKRSGFSVGPARVRETVGPTGVQRREVYTAERVQSGVRQQREVTLDFVNQRARRARVGELRETPVAVVKPPPLPAPPKSRFPGFAGFEPLQFLNNLGKVTGWAAAVGVLYKSLDLVTSSMRAVVETSAQMARLDQVFRGVGGSTVQLTNDVLGLAAANGRLTDEAIASAIAWSRLGLTRAQVNEAVRVSLIAANVAELTAADATQRLQAIMQAYGLSVGQLGTVLAELNSISNHYNVTNSAMLDGLSKTAGVARQAGLPLQELIGIIGATVGATGQTGAAIGTAVKSTIVALSNPVLQELLRRQFRIELSAGADGQDLKGFSQILGEVWVRYQQLNDAQRQSLLFFVAGKTQASRLASILDSYTQAQVLAIQAQQNLTSAEVENSRIKGTLKSQLTGLRTEWERFVTVTATSPGVFGGRSEVQKASEVVRTMRSLLSLLSDDAANESLRTGAGGAMGASLSAMLNLVGDPGFKAFNDWLDGVRGGAQAAARELAGMSDQVEAMGAESGAAQDTARLLANVQKALPAQTPEQRDVVLRTISPVLPPGEGQRLRELSAVNDLTAVGARLESLRAAQTEKARAAKEDEREAARRLNETLRTRLDRLQGEEEGARTSGRPPNRQRQEQIKSLQASLQERVRKILPLEEEESSAPATALSLRSRTQMEDAEQRMEAIQRLYRELPAGPSNVASLHAEEEILRLQISALREKVQFLNDVQLAEARSNGARLSQGQEILRLTDMQLQKEAQLLALRARRPIEELRDVVRIGSEAVRNELLPSDTGRSETDRLLNRRRTVDAMLRNLEPNSRDPFSVARRIELEAQKAQLVLDVARQRFKVEQEINQLLVERQQQFKESLLGRDSRGLLQAMAAMGMAGKGQMTGAQFMALHPDLRGDVAMVDPDFDPRMMQLKRDRARLGPKPFDREQFAEVQAAEKERAAAVGRLAEVTGVFQQTAEAAMALNTAVAAAAREFEALNPLLGEMAATLRALQVPAGPGNNNHFVLPVLPQGGGLNAGMPAGR